MSNFRPINRDTGFLLPPSVDEWLPQRHLARFVVEVIEGLDLSELVKAYRGSGSASYHPAMLLGLLVYGYATKTFSSRAIERATYDSVAFRFIAGNEHPDHDTIAAFRKRFLPQLETLFVEVLKLARDLGMLKMGTVALDGTKVHANASRHSALSYGHAKKIEKQLKREVKQLLRLAERADARDIPDGMSVPEELERRELRLAAIAEAKAKIEARAAERLARERAEHQSKLAARAEQEQRSGKKPRGRAPEPPTGGVKDSDQVNLLMGIEIRLFLGIDAFSAFSGMPLARSERFSLALAKQLLDSSGAAPRCLDVPRRTGSQWADLRRSEEARFAPKIRRFVVPANTI